MHAGSREAATAQVPASSQYQAGVQVKASDEAPRQQPAAVPSASQAKGQDEAPMEIAPMEIAVEHAAGPSSHEIPHPSANSLSVPTARQLATPPLDEMSGAAVDHSPGPATDPLQPRACTPPSTKPMESHGLQAMNTNPSTTAVQAAGREGSVPAAEQQLPPERPSGQPPIAPATAGASASAVAPAATATAGTSASAMAPAAPATAGTSASAVPPAATTTVKPQPKPKRATRFRQNAAAKEVAAPAASLTTTTSSGRARGPDPVGQRIEVWWSGEDRFLPGVVIAFSPSKVPPLREIVSSGCI